MPTMPDNEPQDTTAQRDTIPYKHPSGINPSVGRIVLFSSPGCYTGERPAIITGVNDDGTIEVKVFHRANEPEMARAHTTALHLVSPDTPIPEEALAAGAWCSWMPYQKGQAAKTEALEKTVQDASLNPAAIA